MAQSQSDLVEQIADLNKYGKALNQCHELEEVAVLVLEAASLLFDIDRATYIDVDGDQLRTIHSTDPDVTDEPSAIATEAASTGEVVSVGRTDAGENADPETTASLAVPASVVDDIVTVLVFHATDVEEFDDEYVEPLKILASHAGTAAFNIRIQDQLRAQKAELERQNERLEDFASIVSHDLRSPLNLAFGKLELAREHGDDEYFDKTVAALDRMNDLIEEILTLARKGQTVTDAEELALGTVAATSWGFIDAPEATFENDLELTVVAEKSRMLHLFENLFRNALDHVGPDVTITVGHLEGGFYVADDGPGIPEDEREKIFEKGYTNHEDGTGFGLAIVSEIVEAHGWSIVVTDGTDGGARFEITDVEILETG